MLNTKCNCGADARLVRQIIEYNRMNPESGELSVIKSTFIYQCTACEIQKTIDVAHQPEDGTIIP